MPLTAWSAGFAAANSKGLEFGLKLSNTFPVDVKNNELPSEEMYMAGKALFEALGLPGVVGVVAISVVVCKEECNVLDLTKQGALYRYVLDV